MEQTFNIRNAFVFLIGFVFAGLFLVLLIKGNVYAIYGFLNWAIAGLIFTILGGLIHNYFP